MKYLLYDILFHGFFAATLPYVLYKAATTKKYREGIGERFGRIDREKLKRLRGDGPGVWIHAVSVGETRAVMPLLRGIRKKYPAARILFSTTTRTGQAVAQAEGGDFLDALVYFPLDFSWAVKKVVSEFGPDIFIVVEKEVWPNIYRVLGERGVPIVVVNGVISERSFRRFQKFKFFFSGVFSKIGFYCARTPADLERALALGVREDRAMVAGNLKFDQLAGGGKKPPQGLERGLGLGPSDLLFVAGSTHRGEDEIIISAFLQARKKHEGLRLAIAPRHPERFGEVEEIIRKTGLTYRKRSTEMGGAGRKKIKGPDVFLLDTMGELLGLYGLSHIALVGGSLLPGVGGHNLLEPAALGVPVLFGPHTETCAEMAELLTEAGGGLVVRGPEDLARVLEELAGNRKRREQVGRAARGVVEKNRGSVERTLKVIEGFLEKT
jgi:3-deoxy-D-manno-octulosonic-acid transferase